MIEAATPAAPAAPATPAPSAPATGTPNPSNAQQQSTDLTGGEPKVEKPRVKVGDVEWEQDEDDWYSTQKVNGKEERISHQQALSAARQMAASTERFQQAKAIERNIEGMLASAAQSPRSTADFLTKLGVDVVAFAEDILGQTIEESRMTPEQKRLRDLEARIQQHEEEKREAQRRDYETKAETHARRTREAYVASFNQGLDALHAPTAPEARQWLHGRIAALANHHEDNGIPTTLAALTKQAASDFQRMTGVRWAAPAPAAAAKPAVVVPPHSQQNGAAPARNQRDGRFVPRNDPKPRLVPGDAQSIRDIVAWRERNPGKP